MELKLDRDIVWSDLPEIESPFFAARLVEYGDPCGERIEGVEIFDYSRSLSRKDQLREIIESLENGYIYLLRYFPSSPVFRWVETDRDNGYWERTGSYGHFFDMSADYMLKNVVEDHYHFLDTWRKVRDVAVEEPVAPVMPARTSQPAMEITAASAVSGTTLAKEGVPPKLSYKTGELEYPEVPRKEKDPKIVKVEFLEYTDQGADRVLLSRGPQYVNLPGNPERHDGINIYRQTRKLKARVSFNQPCREQFTLELDPGSNNSEYTPKEEGKNPNFIYTKGTITGTTESNGTKIIEGLEIAAAGKDNYKVIARDNYENDVKSTKIKTYRRVYVQEIKMKGVSAAKNLSTFINEYKKHGIEIVQLPSVQMDHLENIDMDTSNFEKSARKAYKNSGCNEKEPYVVAIGYTDHLAVKDGAPFFSFKNSVEVGPGQSDVTIPLKDRNNQKKRLWKDIAPGESWFVSASFLKDLDPSDSSRLLPNPINIPIKRVAPILNNSSNICTSVKIKVDGLTPKKQTGTIILYVNTVNRFRGGLSFTNGNLISVCTRAWWKTISNSDQNQVMIHEMGHKIGMVPDGNVDIDKTLKEYTGKGHVGSHCCSGLSSHQIAQNNYNDVNIIKSSSCVMFGATNSKTKFCKDCAKAVKKMDISKGWNAF